MQKIKEGTQEVIFNLNHDYLLLARELIKEDIEEAILVLGIDRESAETIASMSIMQIKKLALSSVTLMNCRFKSADMWRMLDEYSSGDPTKSHLLGTAITAALLRCA